MRVMVKFRHGYFEKLEPGDQVWIDAVRRRGTVVYAEGEFVKVRVSKTIRTYERQQVRLSVNT